MLTDLKPFLTKNDKKANWIIGILSVIVFVLVLVGGKFTINVNLPFDKHLFAKINASLNLMVAILLVVSLIVVKQKKYKLHKQLMLLAILLSSLFLLSYVGHHIFTNPTKFGDANHDGIIDLNEKAQVGFKYGMYYLMLFTHIPLAGIILPFILLSAYRAAIGDYEKHKKLVRFTWPLWLYVAITGVLIYIFIAPYYI
jgi:putative membrane protein